MATVVLLKQRVPEPIAADTAPGWLNDRLMTYEAEGKPRGHVVWQTLWRDSNAADGFFSAARQWLQGRYKDAKPAAQAPEGVFQIENGNGSSGFSARTTARVCCSWMRRMRSSRGRRWGNSFHDGPTQSSVQGRK
jgi:hypothetical protein